MSQLYGRGREESYTPSHGYGQNVYLVARESRPDEAYQTNKKPVVFNYYPSGKTGPQRQIAEVQTVSREVIRHPVAVMEPKKDYPSHVDDQSRRDDEFVTKLQDAAIRANAGKLLGINLDQVQGDYPGNSTIKDGWGMQPTSIDENNPKKVAELFNKVSNWRGVNGHDHGRSSDTYDGWNNNPGGRYGGYGSYGKPGDSYTGWNNNPQAPLSGRSYNDRGENYVGSSASTEWPSTPQGYYQTTHYGGDTSKNTSSINGSYGNSDNMVSGNHGRLDDRYTRWNSPQAPRAGSGYTGQTENLNGSSGLNTPLSTHQDYDQPVSYAGDTHRKPSSVEGYYGDSEDSSFGNHSRPGAPRAGSGDTGQTENLNGSSGWNKPLSSQQVYDGRNNNPQAPRAGSGYTDKTENLSASSGLNKPHSTQQVYDGRINNPQAPRAGNGYTGQTENLNASSGLNKPLSTQQVYDGGNNNPQAPRGGNGYTSQTENLSASSGLNKPLSTQQVYDGRNNNPRAPRAGNGYTSQTENLSASSGLNKPLSTQQVYDGRNNNPQAQRASNGYTGQTENPSASSGLNKPLSTQQVYDGRNNNPQAPRAGNGYTGQRENLSASSGLNRPLSTQQVFDGRSNNLQAPRAGSGHTGKTENLNGSSGLNKPLSKQQVYDGRNNNPQAPQGRDEVYGKKKPEHEAYGNSYNLTSGPNTVRPNMTSDQAVKIYKGSYV